MENLLTTALMYHEKGLRVIPVNSSKMPMCKWKGYTESQTEEDIRRLFKNPCHGIAMLTGVDNIEVIDIDCKYDITGTLYDDYRSLLELTDLVSADNTTIQSTPSGGYHFIYRCEEIAGNKKLASRPATEEELKAHNSKKKAFNEELISDKALGKRLKEKERRLIEDPKSLPKVLLETRGIGGYVLIAPTDGYKTLNLNLLDDIPILTKLQREAVIIAAKTFDSIALDESERLNASKPYQTSNNSSSTACWEDYNNKSDAIVLLEQYGWSAIRTMGERTYLRRPDKSIGISADYNHRLKLFKSYSTSTIFEPEKAYTNFSVYKILEHNGDSSKAAKALYAEGYGDRIKKTIPKDVPKEKVATSIALIDSDTKGTEDEEFSKLLAEIEKTRFCLTDKIEYEKATLHLHTNDKKYRIAGNSMLVGVTGEAGSGKSLLTSMFLASTLAKGKQIVNYTLDIGNRNILYFDTEQPKEFYKRTQRRAYRMANKRDQSDRHISYNLRRFNQEQRLRALSHYAYNTPNIGAIFIDGIVDLIPNYNDLEASSKLMGVLMKMAVDTNACIFAVLHEARSTGNARGHLGTELMNKADAVLSMRKNREQDIYTVTGKKERYKPFPSLELERDDLGFPVSVESFADGFYYDRELALKEAYKEDKGFKGVPIELIAASETTSKITPNLNDDEDIPF